MDVDKDQEDKEVENDEDISDFEKLNLILALAKKNESEVAALRTSVDSNSNRLPFVEADVEVLQREVKNLKAEIRAIKKSKNSACEDNLRDKINVILRSIDRSINTDGVTAVTWEGRWVTGQS